MPPEKLAQVKEKKKKKVVGYVVKIKLDLVHDLGCCQSGSTP